MPTINKPKHIKPKQSKIQTINFAQYYNSSIWKHLRNWYINSHGLCEECLKHGKITPATEVHHIIPFSQGVTDAERWKLLSDTNNLMSLCNACHQKKHKNRFGKH